MIVFGPAVSTRWDEPAFLLLTERESLSPRAASGVSRKGGRSHRLAGTVFPVSILIMATIGAAASPVLPVPGFKIPRFPRGKTVAQFSE